MTSNIEGRINYFSFSTFYKLMGGGGGAYCYIIPHLHGISNLSSYT